MTGTDTATATPLPRRAVLAMLAATALTAARAQTDFSTVEIRAEKLSDTVWMLTGAGGNVGLCAGEDTVFLVDDQFAPLAPKIKAAIARISAKPVQWLLNTHFHFDHTGGNEAFGSTGTVIVAHDNVRRRMSTDRLIQLAGNATPQKAAPKAALPVVTVPGEIRFHINGEELHAFHTPRAHTDGDLVVHWKGSNVIHMGDLFFNGNYPFIDSSSGGTAEGVIAAYDRVLALANERTKIIPGHGRLATKADLATQRDMLAGIVARIKALKREGRSEAEIRAARPSAEFDARYGSGFIKAETFVPMLLGAIDRP